MAPQLLSHVGPPRISTRADIALLLLAATTFFLLVTALASPTWREFDSAAGSLHLSIGLFRACAKRLSFADGIHWECGAAWGADSPLRRFQFLDLFGEFDSESTVAPPAIIAAQTMFILACITLVMTLGAWKNGWQQAALFMTVPAFFALIGLACALGYFASKNDSNPIVVTGLSLGAAAWCGILAVVILLICVIVAVMNHVVDLKVHSRTWQWRQELTVVPPVMSRV